MLIRMAACLLALPHDHEHEHMLVCVAASFAWPQAFARPSFLTCEPVDRTNKRKTAELPLREEAGGEDERAEEGQVAMCRDRDVESSS